jgi:hypothetical protein
LSAVARVSAHGTIVTGFLDADGVNASGRVLRASAVIEPGGRRYACMSASANWTATR